MRCDYACNSGEHFSRRSFLQGATTGAISLLGFSGMVQASAAKQLASTQKQVALFVFEGGVSQLESWDPKPETEFGGPFQAIPTSVPGMHISELLPYTAQQMHHLSLVRSINTRENDHARGKYFMQTGQKKMPPLDYPYLGSIFSSELAPANSALPGYIHIGGDGSPAECSFLSPRFAPLGLKDGGAPQNLELPRGIDAAAEARRQALRLKISRRFATGRRQADTEIYNNSYDQAAALLARRDLFDLSRVPPKEADRYGKHEFGKQCLLARKLLEQGVTFVKVSHRNYDTHSENFNFHIEQLGEWDRPFAAFVSDLAARGMLEHTLIIVMSEFGRTPKINPFVGRDHWGSAWSIVIGGCGIQPGGIIGKTNPLGTQVIDREVHAGHLFQTYYRAVGLDPQKNWIVNGRPVEKLDPKCEPIRELLA
jgi:uncharacterized protein (DUF1501 family)